MTREQAAEILETISCIDDKGYNDDIHQAIQIAVNRLNDENMLTRRQVLSTLDSTYIECDTDSMKDYHDLLRDHFMGVR